MNQYMVEIDLPATLSEEFMALIPEQRNFISEMFEQGIITGYSLALDRSKVWVSFRSKSSRDVERVLRRFPVYRFVSFKIHELAFHEAQSTLIPAISLN